MLFRSMFVLAASAAVASCASLEQVTNFGANPTDIQMFIYVPDEVVTSPAVIVAVSLNTTRLAWQDLLLTLYASCIPVEETRASGFPEPSCRRTLTRTDSSLSTPALLT